MKTKTVWIVFLGGSVIAVTSSEKAANNIIGLEAENGNVATTEEWGIDS